MRLLNPETMSPEISGMAQESVLCLPHLCFSFTFFFLSLFNFNFCFVVLDKILLLLSTVLWDSLCCLDCPETISL